MRINIKSISDYMRHHPIIRNLVILTISFYVCSAILAIGYIVSSTKPSGPTSTNTSSENFATLEDKVAFLEKYVTFRRSYKKLEYLIIFYNNGGGVPGPSDWDITIIAQVPNIELQLWMSGIKPSTKPEGNWLPYLPKEIDISGVSEWFRSGRILVGVDRKMSTIVYRNSTLSAQVTCDEQATDASG